ncbi:stress-responsive transcription factor hsf1 [Nowakowskiella sp. JEL0078]|nr:stress-responsive transcription factor hsf1 [Nowakowskiella sp. JEL0078]
MSKITTTSSSVNTNLNSTTAMAPNVSNLELQMILQEVALIKRNQMTITTDLKNIQRENQQLWAESLEVRDRYQRQQSTIDKILRFLASVFSPKEKRIVPKKRRLLIEEGQDEFADDEISDGAINSLINENSYAFLTSMSPEVMSPSGLSKSPTKPILENISHRVSKFGEDIELLQDQLDALTTSNIGLEEYEPTQEAAAAIAASGVDLGQLFANAGFPAISSEVGTELANEMLSKGENSVLKIPISTVIPTTIAQKNETELSNFIPQQNNTDFQELLAQHHPILAETTSPTPEQSQQSLTQIISGMNPTLLSYLASLRPISASNLLTDQSLSSLPRRQNSISHANTSPGLFQQSDTNPCTPYQDTTTNTLPLLDVNSLSSSFQNDRSIEISNNNLLDDLFNHGDDFGAILDFGMDGDEFVDEDVKSEEYTDGKALKEKWKRAKTK